MSAKVGLICHERDRMGHSTAGHASRIELGRRRTCLVVHLQRARSFDLRTHAKGKTACVRLRVWGIGEPVRRSQCPGSSTALAPMSSLDSRTEAAHGYSDEPPRWTHAGNWRRVPFAAGVGWRASTSDWVCEPDRYHSGAPALTAGSALRA